MAAGVRPESFQQNPERTREMAQQNRLRVRKGFLTFGPVMDSLSRFRDDEEEPGTEPEIEIHNHIPEFGREPDYGALSSEQMDRRHRDLHDRRPRDEEPDDEDGEVVARFPASYHVQTEGDEIVVYSRPPRSQRTDLFDFKIEDRKRRTGDQRPPRTLVELNRFFASYYPRKKTTAAR
jgi:hypothetical protein